MTQSSFGTLENFLISKAWIFFNARKYTGLRNFLTSSCAKRSQVALFLSLPLFYSSESCSNRTWMLSIVNFKSETEVMQISSLLHCCLSNNHATLSLCILNTYAIDRTFHFSPKTEHCVMMRPCIKEQHKFTDIFFINRLLGF